MRDLELNEPDDTFYTSEVWAQCPNPGAAEDSSNYLCQQGSQAIYDKASAMLKKGIIRFHQTVEEDPHGIWVYAIVKDSPHVCCAHVPVVFA